MADAAAPQPDEAKGRGARFWVLAIIIGVAIIVAAILIYNASMAAFTATTDTGGDSFSTGTIDLQNDSEGESVFTASDLTPGDSDTQDIIVTYTGGTIDSEVKLYAHVADGADQNLAEHLDLVISTAGDSSTSDEWTGTLAEFQQITDFSEGILAVILADGQDQTYTVTYTVDEAAPQGAAANVTFVWEAQSQ